MDMAARSEICQQTMTKLVIKRPACTMDMAARSAGQRMIRTRILHWGRTVSHHSYIAGGNHQTQQSVRNLNEYLPDFFFFSYASSSALHPRQRVGRNFELA